jgi:hypothetical protein
VILESGLGDFSVEWSLVQPLATMSRNGKHVIAARSGHHIQINEPELVTTTIREVLRAARER